MRRSLATLLLAALLAGCAGGAGPGTSPASTAPASTGACQAMTKAASGVPANHTAVALETKQGCIVVELLDDKAPITVQNFLKYVRAGFFDDTLFHRVSKEFVLQGGGVDATTGTSKTALHPPIKNEARTSGLHNVAYTLSMARGGGADTATSQFFINVNDNRDCLDAVAGRCDPQRNGYAVFANVVQGRDAVDAIHAVPVTTSDRHPYCLSLEDPQGGSCPVDPVVLVSARVLD